LFILLILSIIWTAPQWSDAQEDKMKSISNIGPGLAAAALAFIGVAITTPASADALPDSKARVQQSQATAQNVANPQQPCTPAAKATAPQSLDKPAFGGYQRQTN
jgi:hypothetical protein